MTTLNPIRCDAMAHTPEAIKKHTRTYLMVGAILFVFTVVTVLVATQEWLDFGRRGFDAADAVIGLAIASMKACFVAAVFMHLSHEKFMVYLLFGIGVVFGAAMFLLIWLAKADPVFFDRFQLG